MENNKFYNRPAYKCGICDKIYDSIAERMHCEQTCLAKQEVEAKKAAEAKKQEEKSTRKAEVDLAVKQANEASDHAEELIRAFIRDYGRYDFSDKITTMENDRFWLDKLSHYFWI